MGETRKTADSGYVTVGAAAVLRGARRGALPAQPEAQLATLVSRAPVGDEWLHEIKFDGYRLMARVEGNRVELWTRNGNDWTSRFPAIAAAVGRLGVESALLDGEVVAQLADGRTSFQTLQNSRGDADLRYYGFDLLFLDGLDLTQCQLDARKNVLREVLAARSGAGGPLRYSDHVIGQGQAFFEQVCAAGLEGVVSKRRSGRYQSGRSGEWLKVKCLREQEFVVVGYTDPCGSRAGLGALLLATSEHGQLAYRGKVGTGMSGAVLRELRERMEELREDRPSIIPGRAVQSRGVHWIRPEMVVQVAFTEITPDGLLRHPVFRGVLDDREARHVVLETPLSSPVAGTDPLPSGASARFPAVVRRDRQQMEVAGVRISSPDKVLYPEKGFTKEAVARYYEAVAPWILPHISDRPLTLVRCPQGHAAGCFFQKHMDEVDSPYLRRVQAKEAEGARDYLSVCDLRGILAVVQLGALELHSWNSRADKLEFPDRVTIDIDPDPTVSWDGTVQAALEVRALLGELGLESFVKTTGGKGLHVVVPLVRRSTWEEVKGFARALAGTVAAASPGRYTLQLSKSRRKDRLLLDYLRNTRGATAVEVYSTRARAGAPVSTPVSWAELGAGVDPQDFTIETVPARLAAGIDPWREYGAARQSLTAPLLRRLGLR